MTLPATFTFSDGTGFRTLQSQPGGSPWASIIEWESIYYNAGGSSNEGQIGNSGTGTVYAWAGDTFDDDHSVQVTATTTLSVDGTSVIVLALRIQSYTGINIFNGQGTLYFITFQDYNIDIEKVISGSYTTIYNEATEHGRIMAGDVLKAEIIGSDINVYVNGDLQATLNDTSIPSGGRPGMGGWCTSTQIRIDNAVLDNAAAAPPSEDLTGALHGYTGVRAVCAGTKTTTPTLPAQDNFSTVSTLTDPPWNQIGGTFFISSSLGPSFGWAAAGLSSGGFSTVGADFFTDTNGTLLEDHTSTTGGSWVYGGTPGTSNTTINASGQGAAGASGDTRIHYEPAPSSTAYRVLADFIWVSNQGNKIGLHVRDQGNSGLADCYEVMFEQSNTTWTLQRWISGQTTLDTYVDSGFTSGTKRVEMSIDGSGNISVLIDDVERLSATDTNAGLLTKGFAGILLGAGAPNGMVIDNFLVQEGAPGSVGGGADSLYIWNDDEFPADQYSQVVIKSTPWADTSQYMMLMVRVNPVTTDFYSDGTGYIVYTDGGSSTYLQKWVAGAVTELERDDTIAWDVDDELRLEVDGSAITFYVNDVAKLTTTDSSIASGQPGIGGFATSELLYFDDWEGDVAGGSSIDLVGTAVGRAGAKPTLVSRKQGASANTPKTGARATVADRKQALATPTARSGVQATNVGVKKIVSGAATGRSAAKAVAAGQGSKSVFSFAGVRGVNAGVRPASATAVSKIGIQASVTTGKVVTTAIASGSARLGARVQSNPYTGIGSIALSQPAVVYQPAPFAYNITLTGTTTSWSEDTTWTITPSSSGGPSLASSSIIVSTPSLANWIFTLGPGTGSFTISDGINNAILVVLPASFTITPGIKTWVPTTGLTFALAGAGTAWTDDTTWTITNTGNVSLAASQITVTDTTHATWTLTLGPGNTGVFTISDGILSQTLTITSGVAVTSQVGPRGFNSGRSTRENSIVARDGIRSIVASLIIGASTATVRSGVRTVSVKVKQGLATPLAKFGARVTSAGIQIKVLQALGRLGVKSTDTVLKQGLAAPTLRTYVKATNAYLKTGLAAPNEHIGVRATNAAVSSATTVIATGVAGVAATCSGRAQFIGTITARTAVVAQQLGTPVTARSVFASVGVTATTTGIKGGQATPVTSVVSRSLCSGAKLGVQSPITARAGVQGVEAQLKQGQSQPTVKIGVQSVISAPQSHAKPLQTSTAVRALNIIAGNKRNIAGTGTGRVGGFSRLAGLSNQDKTAISRFGARSRTTGEATVGPVVENVPAILRAGDRTLATLRAWDALRR